MTGRLFTLFVGYALSLVFPALANGDQWSLPVPKKYFSPNKTYCLEVIPKKLDSQLKYFEDKVNNRENPGASKGSYRGAKGILYKANEAGSYRRIRSFPLVNEVSPLNAVVSNTGTYFVTFDNWHSAGYGADAVVIYRSDGSLVRQLALDDFLTQNDIETLPTTISSRWWGGDHYIDDEGNILVLRIISSNESQWQGSALEGAKFYELRLSLSNGNLIKPRRDILPRWDAQVSSGVDSGMPVDQGSTQTPDQSCAQPDNNSVSSSLMRVPSSSLITEALSAPLPPYPPLARAARVEGGVLIEIAVAETGTVYCARAVSGHPLLRASAVAAARKWTFKPTASLGKPTRLISTLAFHFRFVKIVPAD
jgi:TonB family protein